MSFLLRAALLASIAASGCNGPAAISAERNAIAPVDSAHARHTDATSTSTPRVASPARVASNTDRVPVPLVSLRFHDRTLTVVSGQRFNVTDAQGRVLAEALGENELAMRYPELHSAYRSAVAKTGPVLDATLRRDLGNTEP